MNNQWTKDIRNKLASMEKPAPEMDWNAIFRAVDEQRAARRCKTVALYRRLVAAAVLAGILVGGAVYVAENSSTEPLVAIRNASKKSSAAQQDSPARQSDRSESADALGNAGISDFSDASAETEESGIKGILAAIVNKVEAPFVTTSPASEPVFTASLAPETAAAETTVSQSPSAELQGEQLPAPSSQRSVVRRDRPTSILPSSHRSSGRRTVGFGFDEVTAKAYVGGIFGGKNSASAMGMMAGSEPEISDDVVSNDAINYPDWNEASAMDRKVKHHQPIRLGVSVRYQLSPRWSIEGGLSYSHHSSDITETSGDYSRQTDQSLTFIGVPVNVNYSIYSNRYINVYASAGGEVERLVKGKATTTTSYAGEPSDNKEEKIKMSRPVFSANAAVGVEAKLGQTASIYAEPGLSYHFKNGSGLETIYSDKQLNANLNLGIRFTIK